MKDIKPTFDESKYHIETLVKFGLDLDERHYEKFIKPVFDKLKRYEKVLKEIAEDEENCEYQSEMGFMDYYDGYEKTMKAKEALEEECRNCGGQGVSPNDTGNGDLLCEVCLGNGKF